MLRLFLLGVFVAWMGGLHCTRADEPPPPSRRPACERVPGAHFALEGPVRRYLEEITRHWLLPAPGANPAMLAMFRDRDRLPYRDLLPWSGEFAGKYLTGATGVLRLTGDPELRRHL